MKITIIGCDGAYPSVNGATSSYLVEDKSTKVLLDLGSGSMSKLQNYIQLKELTGIVISHYHRDHYADLECMHFATMIDTLQKERSESLEIYGPGEEQMLTYKNFCVGRTYKKKENFKIGSLTFSTCLNKHGVEAYSIKVKNEEGKAFVYTGDTGYFKELGDFCKGTNLLIAEASLFQKEKGKMGGHMTSGEAAEVAKEGEVKTLVLTHLPHYGDVNLLVDEAKEFFDGEIMLAKSGIQIEVY